MAANREHVARSKLPFSAHRAIDFDPVAATFCHVSTAIVIAQMKMPSNDV
jgi:hypothetical protein